MSEESLSVFDIFKVGIGPSSSHTMGPWRAAQLFVTELRGQGIFQDVIHVSVTLYGSLAKTGLGHGTDIAVMLGLSGEDPVTIAPEEVFPKVDAIKQSGTLFLGAEREIFFSYPRDVIFCFSETLAFHSNGLVFAARTQSGAHYTSTYYSTGGGFVQKEPHEQTEARRPQAGLSFPYQMNSASDAVNWCRATGKRLSDIVMENELSRMTEEDLREGLRRIFQVMQESVYRGCHQEGVLPGGLNVMRRAPATNKGLLDGAGYNDYQGWKNAVRQTGPAFKNILDWVSCFALAVNEENASYGRIVTAPTNGSAGVIPAVLHYYTIFCDGDSEEKIQRFLLAASEIGSLFKRGATISAAMGGCQAEIGVSSAMAAAGLTECMGGSVTQVLMAAEIAMEHHLGLTCDPIGGLVQIPCIERNAMGAVKAITASQLALQGNPAEAKVSLDVVIRTMWETAMDMDLKYKETSEGGLAVNIPLSLPEC